MDGSSNVEDDVRGSTAGYMPCAESDRESSTVESRWANTVKGAGSVKSSAGTYTAWKLVIEPFFVEVMRSWSAPISVPKVGW
jgi:hypothetical protein